MKKNLATGCFLYCTYPLNYVKYPHEWRNLNFEKNKVDADYNRTNPWRTGDPELEPI